AGPPLEPFAGRACEACKAVHPPEPRPALAADIPLAHLRLAGQTTPLRRDSARAAARGSGRGVDPRAARDPKRPRRDRLIPVAGSRFLYSQTGDPLPVVRDALLPLAVEPRLTGDGLQANWSTGRQATGHQSANR